MRESLRRYGRALFCVMLFGGFMTTAMAQTELAVHLKLINADDQPLPATRARLVLGNAMGWQRPNAGQTLQTDAAGEAILRFANVVEQGKQKRPTNFVDSLFSRAELTDHVQAAIELEYAGRQRLIAIQFYRFRDDASVLMNGFDVYTPDKQGAFTIKGTKVNGYDWRIAEPDGTYSGHPGYELVEFSLKPVSDNASNQQWSLRLVLRRLADPVRR